MTRTARTTVRPLPAGLRLEDLSEWLSDVRLAAVGLRRRYRDVVLHRALPGERYLLLVLELGETDSARRGAVGIVLEAGEHGDERWARVTVQVDGSESGSGPGAARAMARALGFALRRAVQDRLQEA